MALGIPCYPFEQRTRVLLGLRSTAGSEARGFRHFFGAMGLRSMVAKRSKKPAKKKASKRKTKKKASKRKTKKKAASRKKAPAKKAPARKVASAVPITRLAEWSISQFALNTGFAHNTVRNRFAEAKLEPCSKVRGHNVFLVQDGLRVLYYGAGDTIDPDKLKPFDRRAYYQAELDKLKLGVERGELVPAFEMESVVGQILKIWRRSRDTIPDRLERDIGLPAHVIEAIEKFLDEESNEMADEIGRIGEDAGRAVSGGN